MKKIFLLTLLLSLYFCSFAQSPRARAASIAHYEFSDPDVIEFALITDTHGYGPTADVRESKANVASFVKYCGEHPELQFALYGGDFMNAYDTNHEQALWCLNRSRDDFSGFTLPFYTTKGNHDCNGKQWKGNRPDNTQIITDEEYYQLFSPLSATNPLAHPEGIVTDPENPHSNYYYRDFEAQRFRLIMLNNYDRDSLEVYGYHGQQMKWLAEVALDFSQKASPADWCFIIVGHAFSINHEKNPITRLMHAYVRGQDFSDTDNGITYGGQYSRKARAQCAGLLGGHFHEDLYWNWDGYNIISFSRGFATDNEVFTSDSICYDHIRINTRTRLIEDQRIGRGPTRRLFSYSQPEQLEPKLPFPGADGLGSYTQGGANGQIIHVTNLHDQGKGSLRWALDQQGRRIVVFDVEGTINLESPLIIQHDSITIAGQSAPGAGISLEGAPVVIQASEVVMRYLTLHTNLTDGAFGQQGLIIDHLTLEPQEGTGIAIRRTEDVSVQFCRFIGKDGNDSPALLAGGYKATYLHNLITDCANAIMIPDEEGCNRWIHIVRNVIQNWRSHAIYGGNRQGECSVEGNYLLPGVQTANFHLLDVAEDGTGRYYVSSNVMKGLEQYNRRNALMVNDRSGIPYYALATDTLERMQMKPEQRPHRTNFTPSCLVIAAFHNKPIFKHPTKEHTLHQLQREAGSQYRPQAVCPDSLLTGDVEGYLQRLAQPERSIVVLFENDVHCAIERYPYLAGYRDLVAADTAWVAITSSGDYLQGGLAGSVTHGQAIADIMQCIGYDAITLGNHEFDFPLEHTRKLLHDIGAPVVSANLRDCLADTLVFAPYVIHQYGRRKVAFVGVTTPTTEETNHFALLDQTRSHIQYDLSRHTLYKAVQRAVNHARKEGADYVILLSHLGEENESGITSHSLIAATTGIDAVLDGHTHTLVSSHTVSNYDGVPVPIAQTGTQFANIGKLVIDPDGKIYTEMIDASQFMYRHPTTSHMVQIVQEQLLSSAKNNIGHSNVPLVRQTLQEQLQASTPDRLDAGYLLADALRQIAHTDIALVNAGCIRKDLPAGNLTEGDIVEMLPYDNHLCTFQLTGTEVMRLLVDMYSNMRNDEKRAAPISGLRITIEAKKKRIKVMSVEVEDPVSGEYSRIDTRRTYTIASTDYCFQVEQKRIKQLRTVQADYTTGLLYSTVLSQYIKEALGGVVDDSSVSQSERIKILASSPR